MYSEEPRGFYCQSWTVPKDGSTQAQNEDACRVHVVHERGRPDGLLIALADGTTEAVYSGPWARTLAAAVHPAWLTLGDAELTECLDEVRSTFSPFQPDAQVPWYVRNKFLTQGSQATLLAVSVEPAGGRDELLVKAVGVGDGCLILFRPNGDVHAFPVQSSADLGVMPGLIRNRVQKNLEYQRCQASLSPGDLLLICSDAVGKWLLQCLETMQSEMLFDALIALLLSNGPEEETSVVRIPGPWQAQPIPEWRRKSGAGLGSVMQLMQRFRQWWSPWSREPHHLSGPVLRQEIPSSMPLDFEQLVERQRSSGSPLRMRNDDATLALCLPMREGAVVRRIAALQTLENLRASFARRPAHVRPVHEAPQGARARRWPWPWSSGRSA